MRSSDARSSVAAIDAQQRREEIDRQQALSPCRRLVIPFGPVTLHPSDVERFAREFDAQPMHLDPVAAKGTPLGSLSASGWQTCALAMELIQRALSAEGLRIAVPGVETVVWQAPVRPRDAISGTFAIGETVSCGCGHELSKAVVSLYNQHGTSVARLRMDCVVGAVTATRQQVHPRCDFRARRKPRALRQTNRVGLKFFEDVEPGDELDLGSYELTSARCEAFLRSTAGNVSRSIDIDETAIVPAWLVPSAWMHCIVRYYNAQSESARKERRSYPRLGPAAGVRHLRWEHDVQVGAVLAFRAWAERKLEIGGRRDYGLLVAGAEAFDAAGRRVASFYPQLLLERRTAMDAP